MIDFLYQYLVTILLCTSKFIFGPLSGVWWDFHLWETIILTVTGMMTTVVVFSYLGSKVRQNVMDFFMPGRRLFTPKNRRIIRVWRKYGLYGIAFLTPLILMPIGGTLVAVSFREKPGRIFRYMLVSAFLWASLMTYLVDRFEKLSLHYLG